MKALITGSRGTVGSVLCQRLQATGGTAIGWDRERGTPGDWESTRRHVHEVLPEAIFHLALPSVPTGRENEGWLVNEKWTADLSALASEASIPFIYVSTVMVFTNKAIGPFTPDSTPDETEGYGHAKRRGEEAAFASGATARVARIGWQIGRAPGTNNMVHYLDKQFRETGEVTASSRWLPATSFLEDTADALLRIGQLPPGLYHVDSNERWNFHQIVVALNDLLGNPWKVRETEDFTYDQRMTDSRPQTASLATRLSVPPSPC
jgi:dTDP-4-dehydrorhamnose reductase